MTESTTTVVHPQGLHSPLEAMGDTWPLCHDGQHGADSPPGCSSYLYPPSILPIQLGLPGMSDSPCHVPILQGGEQRTQHVSDGCCAHQEGHEVISLFITPRGRMGQCTVPRGAQSLSTWPPLGPLTVPAVLTISECPKPPHETSSSQLQHIQWSLRVHWRMSISSS